MNDVKLKCERGNFKLRVAGVIQFENKVLAVEIKDCGFFCFPGGHVELGETSKEAVVREIKEETDIDVMDANIIIAHENIFERNGCLIHEKADYYLITPSQNSRLNMEEHVIIENDKGALKKLRFKWFALEELHEVDLRPYDVKVKLIQKNFDLEHLVTKEV